MSQEKKDRQRENSRRYRERQGEEGRIKRNEKRREYVSKNKEEISEKAKARNKQPDKLEKIRAYSRKYYTEHKEECKNRTKLWY